MTVYLSMSLTVILSLILALLYGAQISASRMKAELVTDISMKSVLGEYNRELFDRYGLLLIDTAYGGQNGSVTKLQDHLSEYFTKNFKKSTVGKVTRRTTMMPAHLDSANITGYSLATDGGGAVLRRQIAAYMKSEPVSGAISEIEKNVDVIKLANIENSGIAEVKKDNADAMSETYEDDEGEEYSIDNPAGEVTSYKSAGILTLAAPDFNALSDRAVDTSRYYSNRQNRKGTGLDEEEPEGTSVITNEYIYEKCGCYGKENENSPLKYEMEYIYAGKESDYKNLEKVVEKIFLWKEASNFLYLNTDEVKKEEAAALALTASVLIANPELESTITQAILLAWSFAETIADIRILLTGGRVPLVTSADSWNLSLEEMLNFRENLPSGGGYGLSYEDYLKLLIFMEKTGKKTGRLMDIIEMNLRKTNGNAGFRLDNCVDVFRAGFEITGAYGKKIEIERIYGYEM